jgi:hypothetical protein
VLPDWLDPRLIAGGDHEHAGALGDRLDDRAGESEQRRLVGRAVADGERPAFLGEPVEHAPQRRTQGAGVLSHELGIGIAQLGGADGAVTDLTPRRCRARS